MALLIIVFVNSESNFIYPSYKYYDDLRKAGALKKKFLMSCHSDLDSGKNFHQNENEISSHF